MSALKKITVAMLRPLARASERCTGFKRVWAHTRLAAKIQFPVDSSVVILGVPEIHGTGRIRLGSNLYLYRELYFETQEDGQIEIGDRVVISRGAHLIAFAGISIGEGSMIGEYTSIRDANHRFGDARVIRDGEHDAEPIHIGRNVWIGRGVTVLAGCSIGDHAVVGANAVVTRDVPARAVVAGVPARPIRQTVTQ